jgi:hypothetical protein
MARFSANDLTIMEPLGGVIEELVYRQAVGLHDTWKESGERKAGRRDRARTSGQAGNQKVLSTLSPYWRGAPAK